MWAERIAAWLTTATSLLAKPPSDDDPYPNDRLPSEQVIGFYALRGYRHPQGRDALVCRERYFEAVPFKKFATWHAQNVAKWVSRDFVERDLECLEALVDSCDAVRVTAAR